MSLYDPGQEIITGIKVKANTKTQ